MASSSETEGRQDQVLSLRAMLSRWLCIATGEGDTARGDYARAKAERIKAQIAELEARRDDELGGGRWEG